MAKAECFGCPHLHRTYKAPFMPSATHEGEIVFNIPGVDKTCKTWYKVYGDLTTGSRRPLVFLHGGPGLSSDYLYTLEDLTTKYGIPVVLYDQIGGGKSTLLPEKNGDEAFWVEELFKDELDNLL